MKVTTYERVVENGQIRLPDKAKVYVVVPEAEAQPSAYVSSPRLVHPEQITDFTKEVAEER